MDDSLPARRDGSAVVPFDYGEKQVRTVVVDGEPWFVLADLCRVLELSTPGKVAARLEEGMSSIHTLQTAGGRQSMTVVSESGMYEVVIRSAKPEAVNFRRWITSEVLPTIRKTGGAYIAPGSQAELDLTNPDTALDKLIEIAQVAKAERAKRLAAEGQVAELEPKAKEWSEFIDTDETLAMLDVAKMLGIGRSTLFGHLKREGVLMKDSVDGKGYKPYRTHEEWFKVIPSTYVDNETGEVHRSFVSRVHPESVPKIRDFLVRRGKIKYKDVA